MLRCAFLVGVLAELLHGGGQPLLDFILGAGARVEIESKV
jgi:hypothetical protein